MASDEKCFTLEVEFAANMVPERTARQIEEVFLRASRDIHAKVALLSNPRVVQVRSQEFKDGRYVDLNLELSQ